MTDDLPEDVKRDLREQARLEDRDDVAERMTDERWSGDE